jgi:hypothetical protein
MGTLELTMARLQGSRLDERLACGADPAESSALAARADLLLRPRMRHALQAGLRRAVAEARLVQCPRSSAVHVDRAGVGSCGPELLALAAEIGDAGVRPRGIALARRLLCDGAGPLYSPGAGEELLAAVREARAAL